MRNDTKIIKKNVLFQSSCFCTIPSLVEKKRSKIKLVLDLRVRRSDILKKKTRKEEGTMRACDVSEDRKQWLGEESSGADWRSAAEVASERRLNTPWTMISNGEFVNIYTTRFLLLLRLCRHGNIKGKWACSSMNQSILRRIRYNYNSKDLSMPSYIVTCINMYRGSRVKGFSPKSRID